MKTRKKTSFDFIMKTERNFAFYFGYFKHQYFHQYFTKLIRSVVTGLKSLTDVLIRFIRNIEIRTF